jgi:hypothetical protein
LRCGMLRNLAGLSALDLRPDRDRYGWMCLCIRVGRQLKWKCQSQMLILNIFKLHTIQLCL